MKTPVILIFLFVFSSVLKGQIGGDGSYDDPYTGTISSSAQNFTISGTKYFDEITVEDGVLTISPGALLYAKNTTSFILITATGALNADGSSDQIITFTADNIEGGGPDGSWFNISFYESTGNSIIDHALIERGTGYYDMGGGLMVYGNNISVNNTTVQNCHVLADGGGVYMYPTGTNVNLSNLIIRNNSAAGNGGGLVMDGEASTTVSNCDIYNNTADLGDGVYFLFNGSLTNSMIHDHSGGAAIYASDLTSGSSVRNCIIYDNATGLYFQGYGNSSNCTIVQNATGIISGSALAPEIINTLIWGNTTQYTLLSGANLAFGNCGISGGLSGITDRGGNKTLSSTNTDDTGPNFANPGLNDFHINAAISPVVDNGISSYTGVTIPTTDVEGNSRIGSIDIGAYEFFYYIWSGQTSTEWTTTTNWEGSPAIIPTSFSGDKIIIPTNIFSNYPVVSGDLTLTDKCIFTIDPLAALTVSGATSVESGCVFTLKSDLSGSANFITGTSVSGSFNVELFLEGGSIPGHKWHYVTTPVNGLPKTILTTAINNPSNLLDFREAAAIISKDQGWNWHDGSPGIGSLDIKRGYNVYVSTDQTAIFTGSILAGSANFINSNITKSTVTDASISGWNLIGNPFTSAIDANDLILSSKLIDKAIYFTRNNGYLSWNTLTGEGTGEGVSNIVPALQGFFVHAATGGPGGRSVTIPLDSRVLPGRSLYKGSTGGESVKTTHPIIKFKISDNISQNDDAIIYFFDDATTSFDTDYDAFKLFREDVAYPQIFTVSESNNLGINGLPMPETTSTIPVKVRIGTAKNYTISVLRLENLDEYDVTLVHGTNSVDLKSSPEYTFYGTPGVINNMSIEFRNLMTGTPEVIIPKKDDLRCWYQNGKLMMKTESTSFENNSYVIVYDLNGSVIFEKNKVALVRGEVLEIPMKLINGLYITKIRNSNISLSHKLVVTE